MYHLNLLPWREARRVKRQRQFVVTSITTAVGAFALLLLVNWYISGRIDNQQQRNRTLTAEIAKLDQQIATIENLKNERQRLLSRKTVIEELQVNRTLMVHLFDELATTVPEGLSLTRVQQQGNKLFIDGMTQSNARVSTYLRNIDASAWLHDPELIIIEEEDEATPDQPYSFRVQARLAAPGGEDSDAMMIGGEVASS
jgi:type IV pilus assembly protein PilN